MVLATSRSFRNRSPTRPRTASTPAQAWSAPALTSSSSYRAGDRLVLERNPDYYGAKPKWDRVTFRFIADDGARVAALLGGDVDLIDFVPPRLIERFKSAPNVNVFTGVSDRPIYLIMDTERDESPFMHGTRTAEADKKPAEGQARARGADHGIDRDLLTKRVMEGAAEPHRRPVAPHFAYSNPSIPDAGYNVETRPRSSWRRPGYPDGFSSDRALHQRPLCQ